MSTGHCGVQEFELKTKKTLCSTKRNVTYILDAMGRKMQDSCRTFTMFRLFSLLLLFCLVYHSENTSKPVTGIKGGNVTLTCESEADKIVHIDFFSESGDIDVCQTEECSGRVFKTAACDVVFKNLSFSDAGKYTLRVYYKNDQTNIAQQTKERMYQLHIHDDVAVKTGKPLKMRVLLSNAHKVEKHSSEGWKELWERGHGVRSNRMTDTDGNLIITEFMASDAGSYRVLDAEGETLITVTVTESSRELTDKLDTDDDNTEQHQNWIVPVGVCSGIVIVIALIIWRCRRRRYTQAPTQEKPEPPEELENL